jgi:hypothetical protein
MRLALVFVALSMAISTPVRAAVLPVQATLEIRFGAYPTIGLSGAGIAAVNSSAGGLHVTRVELGAGVISGTALIPLTDPGAAPTTGLQLDVANAAGTIEETAGGSLTGVLGLPGALKLCLFGAGGCNAAVANITVPLTPIGQGGNATAIGPANVSVFGAPWTTATASIGSITAMGFAHGPASGTSSTAQPGGTVQLITPIHITTNIGVDPVIPAFAFLTLQFVPEPATVFLLGGGIAVLVWRGRRR